MADSDSEDDVTALQNYFDLTKPQKKVYLTPGRYNRERNEHIRRAQEAESYWKDKVKNVDPAQTHYFFKYQDEERARMAEATAQSSVFEGGRRATQTRAMSEIEVDTIGASSLCEMSIAESRPGRGENIRGKFNMNRNASRGSRLPVVQCRKELLEKIDAYPVTVVSGVTGCGKSTQIPQFILDQYAADDNYVNIIVTQPRRLAAKAVAERVCMERNWQLGALVGYKVGLEDAKASKDTRLLYVTTGVLIKMLINKKSMAEYTHIILDEVHERDKDMDFLLILTRRFLTSNSQGVKLVLMSATLNSEKLLNYFSWPMYPKGPLVEQGIKFVIPGSLQYDVMVFYLDELVKNNHNFKPPAEKPCLSESCVLKCKEIIFEGIKRLDSEERDRGAVLIFLPGEFEIKEVMKALKGFDPENKEKLVILPLYSRMPFNDAQKIFDEVDPTYRKIILSTNMAESSVTIPDVSYVIDFCMTKKLISDPATNYSSLQLQWASKSSCEQRKGRAGRVKAGRVFRLVFKDFYERVLPREHEPEMRRAPLDKIILDAKILDMGSPKEILSLAMDPPDLHNITTTVMNLKDLGALLPTISVENTAGELEAKFSLEDGDMTVLGEIIAHLPIDTRLAKLVIFGYLFDVLDEAIIIAAGLSGRSIFSFPFDEKLHAFANKLLWSNHTSSDCLAVLMAYQVWKDKVNTGFFRRSFNNENQWCKQRFLQQKSLREMDLIIAKIKQSLEQYNIKKLCLPNRRDRASRKASDNDYLMLKVAIYGAFYPNYFLRSHGNMDMADVHREINGLDPFNTIYMSGLPPDQVKYAELYVNQIKELFKDTQPNKEMIDVQIENTKILVHFKPHLKEYSGLEDANITIGDEDLRSVSSRINLTTNISHHVYVGMKQKQSKDFKIMLYGQEESEKLWRHHTETSEQITYDSSRQLSSNLASRGQRECQLRGPFHPLEFSLASVHKLGCQRQIRVEPESVNSVLLDQYPEDVIDQFLVASQVTLTPSGRILMARGTTFMPNSRGLGYILAMMFAPKVEMRIDNKGRRYTGCLAGLGHKLEYDPTIVSYSDPGLPAYNAEHDMELRFDTVIDNNDIEEINRIRFYINAALSRIPEVQKDDEDQIQARRRGAFKISIEKSAIEYQDLIRQGIDNLLFRDRKVKSKELHVSGEYKWGVLRHLEGKLNMKKPSVMDQDYFLKLITVVDFPDSMLDRADEIIIELRKLKRLSQASSCLQQVPCPICPNYQCFTVPRDAREHLDSPDHKSNLIYLRNKVSSM